MVYWARPAGTRDFCPALATLLGLALNSFFLPVVLPAYGYVLLALVKHSNEGGPGTQEIIGEEDSGPIRTTQQVLVYLLPFPQKQVMRITWLYPQAIRASQARPPPAPFKYTLHPMQRCQQRPGSVKITLQPLIRGRRPCIKQGMGVETILGFSACLYEVRQLS